VIAYGADFSGARDPSYGIYYAKAVVKFIAMIDWIYLVQLIDK